MKISVNCPSYKRPKVKSLEYLRFLKVWVDNKEVEEYKKENPKFKENIISCPDGIQGNVSRVRNYILKKEFENGADVVCIIDDDLIGLFRYEKDKQTNFGYVKKKIEEEDFFEFIEKYSILCEEMGLKLWGVNVNSDALSYRHYSPFSMSSVILGPFSCHLKGTEVFYDEKLPLKEDYDLAIQHLNKYRGILRLNGYFYLCKQSINPGGCASYRNFKNEKEQFELLIKKWGRNIIKTDKSNKGRSKKKKIFDYNPIIKVPIKGV